MGNPLHTSLELPQRCLQLIDELWAAVENTKEKQHPELGSLTTTFLLAMSMPIINLPLERLVNGHQVGKYANDRHLDKAVTDAIDHVVGGHPLKDAPFYTPDTWSFFTSGPDFNIAEPMPDDITGALSSKKALLDANKMPVSEFCSILRNSMAHGGIVYLDANGRSTYDHPVAMYAFVSGKFDDNRVVIGLKMLRVREGQYKAFLRSWVNWLSSVGLLEKVA
jgi:hypothetical protein